MDRRSYTLVGVALVIAAAVTGASALVVTGTSPLVVFVVAFVAVLVLGWLLDRAAARAGGGGR